MKLHIVAIKPPTANDAATAAFKLGFVIPRSRIPARNAAQVGHRCQSGGRSSFAYPLVADYGIRRLPGSPNVRLPPLADTKYRWFEFYPTAYGTVKFAPAAALALHPRCLR